MCRCEDALPKVLGGPRCWTQQNGEMTPAWWLEILKGAAAAVELIDAMKDNLGSRLHKSYTDAFVRVIQDATEGLRRGTAPKQRVASEVIQEDVEKALGALNTLLRSERDEDAAAALEALGHLAKDAETLPGCKDAAQHL